MNKTTKPGKLTIRRETLRVLTPLELRLVVGGRPATATRHNCTGRLSGCL